MQDYLQRYLVQVQNTVKCIKFQEELDFCGSPGPLFLPTLGAVALVNLVNNRIFPSEFKHLHMQLPK